ncbi:hypothetical protein [Candidatus Parabeggiatoa sp. HSG14]|uniref:hypothetical protein n=1 Tax=Candidatus Parabeggiatoa sp. HSG14 TaxID=3055593 RepID=UPI0025A6CDAD|nr:hypothetical protein [Thiotrichales bacterium HSG14]
MKIFITLLRLISSILILPFALLLLLFVKLFEWLMGQYVLWRLPHRVRFDINSKELKKLVVALHKLFTVKTLIEVQNVLQRHPILLTEQADNFLSGMIDKAYQKGETQSAKFITHTQEMLRNLRQSVEESEYSRIF